MRQMVYRLVVEPNAGGITPDDFIQTEQVIDSILSPEDPNTKLFWSSDVRHDAEWQQALQILFPTAPLFEVELPAAVLVTKITDAKGDAWFAICYGHGHTLINNEKIVRRWGLKVALNLICAKAGEKEFLRRVDSKIIRANSLVIAKQISRPDSIDSFDVNTQIDILRAISGQPADEEWGSTVYGQDGVSVSIKGNLSDAHNLLGELNEIHDKNDYMQRFYWIDHVFPVSDTLLRSALFDELFNNLRLKNIDTLNLNTPKFTDWGNSEFRLKGTGIRNPITDPTLLDYLNALEKHNSLDGLDIEKLRQHRLINVTNGDSWPLIQCIEGEVTYNQKTYLFFEGLFFEIDIDFIAEVNAYLHGKIQPAQRILPDNNARLPEEDYIISIPHDQQDLLIMDQKTIDGFPNGTSKIEFCDLLSDKYEFIHIKRGIRSSTLSHLIMQAQNSAEMFWRSNEFRNLAIAKVIEVESSSLPPLPSVWSGSLLAVPPSNINAHLILAVTGDWKGVDFIERIPFFSRLSLRLAIQNLEGFNINVEFIKIDEV
jgi:uncharacterized protein (TIGR04141 family)